MRWTSSGVIHQIEFTPIKYDKKYISYYEDLSDRTIKLGYQRLGWRSSRKRLVNWNRRFRRSLRRHGEEDREAAETLRRGDRGTDQVAPETIEPRVDFDQMVKKTAVNATLYSKGIKRLKQWSRENLTRLGKNLCKTS